MSEEYVAIYRSSSTVQTNLIENILLNEGIAVRVIGTRRGGSVGIGQNICSCRFEVPVEDEARSRELLEHLVDGDYALDEGEMRASVPSSGSLEEASPAM